MSASKHRRDLSHGLAHVTFTTLTFAGGHCRRSATTEHHASDKMQYNSHPPFVAFIQYTPHDVANTSKVLAPANHPSTTYWKESLSDYHRSNFGCLRDATAVI